LALAHVLRRPIIVVAETMLRDSEGVALAPIPFGGIYLPFEVSASQCHRTPLLLAYHSAHFSPLVTVDSRSDPSEGSIEGYSIPLVDPDTGNLYPILFAIDPGSDWDWNASQNLISCHPDIVSITIYS
jgi:OTU domain-containing protein 7